nr:uncharacterized protein LOC127316044 [Lolium perenne]
MPPAHALLPDALRRRSSLPGALLGRGHLDENFVMNYNMQNMNKELPELFSMLKSAEIEIQKEHQVLMVNKTTSFKKQGKPKKGNVKKGGKKAAAPPEKPKGGPKPDTECYYCNGKGHWKRNCPKYLADLKSGLVKKKNGISDIHVIDVYLTGSRTSKTGPKVASLLTWQGIVAGLSTFKEWKHSFGPTAGQLALPGSSATNPVNLEGLVAAKAYK